MLTKWGSTTDLCKQKHFDWTVKHTKLIEIFLRFSTFRSYNLICKKRKKIFFKLIIFFFSTKYFFTLSGYILIMRKAELLTIAIFFMFNQFD